MTSANRSRDPVTWMNRAAHIWFDDTNLVGEFTPPNMLDS
jgi:hypothetical protein